jgi:hypothetical protein
MQPRYCLKNGKVYWSATPNAEDLDVSGEHPFDGHVLTVGALRALAHAHFRAAREHPEGVVADLAGAALDKDSIRLAAFKTVEGSKEWSEILASADGGVRAQIRLAVAGLRAKA